MPDIQASDVTYVSAPQRVGYRPPRSSLGHLWSYHTGVSSTEIQGGAYIVVSLQSLSGGDLRAINYPIGSIGVGNVPPLAAAEAVAAEPAAPAPVLVETVASHRVRLLAKQYENKASPEDAARLAILTARLSRLAPRTTEADIAKLEETAAAADEIQARIDALSAEFDV